MAEQLERIGRAHAQFLNGQLSNKQALSSPAEGRRSGGAYSPLPARRGNSDTDNRRMSLAAQQRRQSNTQLVQSVSGRRASTKLVPLSMAQIHLIRTLWRQVYMSKGPTVIGETVIHRLFFKHPKNSFDARYLRKISQTTTASPNSTQMPARFAL